MMSNDIRIPGIPSREVQVSGDDEEVLTVSLDECLLEGFRRALSSGHGGRGECRN